ncbi:glucosamine-6-phosphate deaminase [Lentibacillus cibarius]|uniref:Glucosamine-6-phosphate deaminase n=1 Tax=Lentibacillus cibarius TaxID=2583219 RepID=A0A549YEC8_9BACI|nr:glucosamine-6-phosphate deaminase [Lentibacillus cibarius]TMN21364.1 glucosamine-6-phosphate deaminase [Lentibacillus cibarius]TRM10243.1 glucosamine-6-phosphate deaminase [Lentibacillus cibarius]
MEIIRVNSYEEMSKTACKQIVNQLRQSDRSVLGLATGSTPEGLYQQLIDQYKEGNVSFQHVTTFNLDEYVGLAADDPNSYRYYMNEKLFRHIDLPDNKAFLPRGDVDDPEKECQDYEALIKDAGHVDLQVLGLGLNGHIGFNEPGTSFGSRTHMVTLDESTRQANARFFPTLDDVPKKAITMGIDTIMESKKIVLLVSGEKKADAVNQLVNGEVTEEFPASILQKHPNAVLIADEGALSKL